MDIVQRYNSRVPQFSDKLQTSFDMPCGLHVVIRTIDFCDHHLIVTVHGNSQLLTADKL